MSTRHSRPVRGREATGSYLWKVLPALLLTAGLGLVLLPGVVSDAPAFQAEPTSGLPSLPPAA